MANHTPHKVGSGLGGIVAREHAATVARNRAETAARMAAMAKAPRSLAYVFPVGTGASTTVHASTAKVAR